MPNWKKVITSGSNADLNQITGSTLTVVSSSLDHVLVNDIVATNFSGSLLRLDENGTGLRMTNVGAFDNNSGDFRIFATQDLVFSTNGDSNTRLTIDQTSGNASFTGDVIAYASSDKRLKENINPIENATEKIKRIGGYDFNWKENIKHITSKKGNDIGVIAQEIEEVLPQLVTTRDNGYKAVDYPKLIALLIETNKELLTRVEELEKHILQKY